jgi:hypothetical protein
MSPRIQRRKYGGYAVEVMSGRQQLPVEAAEAAVRIVQGER